MENTHTRSNTSSRGRVLAELALSTDEGEFRVVKGPGKIALEQKPREAKIEARGVLDNPAYSFSGHSQWGDFEYFRLDEDNPVGYLPYSSSDAVLNRLPGITGGGYNYRMMQFASLGVSGDPQVPGQSSVELMVSTPDGIDEVEVPTLDGDTVTVAPPLTLRRVQTVTSTGGVTSQRVETFVNGISLGVDSSSHLEMGLRIPSVLGEYEVSSHGQRSINYNEPVDDSYDLAWTIPVRKLQLAESLGPVEATPGQPITISNRIAWDRPGDVVDAKWVVTLRDVFGENYEFYEGTGEDVSATFDTSTFQARGTTPRRYLLIPAGSSLVDMLKAKQAELLGRGEDIRAQTDVVPLVYEIFASAEAFPQQEVFPNSGVQFYQARYFLLSESQAEPAIRIRDLSVDPNPFEPSPPEVAPEDRQVATISAYVDAVGFDGGYVVVEPRIYDQSGNLVRRFEDQYPIDYFELEWDGYDDEGNRVEPQELTLSLTASFCGEVPGTTALRGILGREACFGTTAETRFGTNSTDSSGKLTVQSSPTDLLALGAGTTTPLSVPEKQSQEEALKRVYPLRLPPGPNQPPPPDSVLIVVEDLSFHGDPPEEVTVHVGLLGESGHDEPARRVGTTTIYTGSVDLSNIVQPRAETSLSKSILLGVESHAVTIEQSFQGSPFYGSPVLLGNLFEDLLNPLRTATSSSAKSDASNFRCNGFETVEFLVDPRVNNLQGGAIRAEMKVRSPASILVWAHHGNATNGGLDLSQDSVERGVPGVPEITIRPEQSGLFENTRVERVFINACDSLCFHDYNNNLAGTSGRSFTADISQRDYGGPAWLAAAGYYQQSNPPRNPPKFFGYNFQAARPLVDEVMVEYHNQLSLLQGLVNREGDELDQTNLEPVAWLRANIHVAQTNEQVISSRLCYNACAFDNDYYYYIPRPLDKMVPIVDPVLGQVVISRIPRSEWGNNPKRWDVAEKSVARRMKLP